MSNHRLPFVMQERDPKCKMLLEVIASVLDELVRKGEEQDRQLRKMTKFHGLRAPSINLSDYLQRISQFSGCSNECFILMLVYVDRLVTKKEIPLDALNVHRLVITGILLAAKFFDDHYLDNAHYSAVGGLPKSEINELELEFLFLLGFNLYVSTENFNTYYDTLNNMMQARTTPTQPPVVQLVDSVQFAQQSVTQTPSPYINNNRSPVSYENGQTRYGSVDDDQWVQVNSSSVERGGWGSPQGLSVAAQNFGRAMTPSRENASSSFGVVSEFSYDSTPYRDTRGSSARSSDSYYGFSDRTSSQESQSDQAKNQEQQQMCGRASSAWA